MTELRDCDAIILCGGLGTRIRNMLLPGQPKAMADINGRPFINVLLGHLRAFGFRRFTLCVGYGQDQICEAVAKQSLETFFCEHEQFGTGGALRLMMRSPAINLSDPFFVFNGDTISYGIPYDKMFPINSVKKHLYLVTAFRYNHRNVGTFAIRNNRRFKHALEWEPRERFNFEELPIHSEIGIVTVDQPFIDIGSPAGLMEARERFR